MAPIPTPAQITRLNSRSITSPHHWCCSNQKRVAGDQQDCRGFGPHLERRYSLKSFLN
jgi:hypothetical protein